MNNGSIADIDPTRQRKMNPHRKVRRGFTQQRPTYDAPALNLRAMRLSGRHASREVPGCRSQVRRRSLHLLLHPYLRSFLPHSAAVFLIPRGKGTSSL
jgi:hypothetical protein